MKPPCVSLRTLKSEQEEIFPANRVEPRIRLTVLTGGECSLPKINA